ncbi:MAG: DUF5667 domain-containing protein [Candidatus Levyibacteriota bacterium]
MKKLVLIMLVAMLLMTGAAQAQEEGLPDPGVTPDSPLYFLDTIGENISLLFAFSAEAKAQKASEIASEKLAETKAMADKGNEEGVEKAAGRYSEMMSTAAKSLAAAAQSGEGFGVALSELIAKATSIHLSVLTDVYERVPDQAKPSIERAMQESTRGQQEALNAVSSERRGEVEREIEQSQQELQERLDGLRQEGKPIPDVQILN